MIEARALICLLLLAAILTILFALNARAAGADLDIIGCSSSRGSDRDHWAWREIDGRQCWYRGRPGRPKYLLRWTVSAPRQSGEKGRPEIGENQLQSTPDLGADPIQPKPVTTEEITWQPTPEDEMKAFTCCWPELARESSPPTIAIPRATPPGTRTWPIIVALMTLLVTAIAIAARSLS